MKKKDDDYCKGGCGRRGAPDVDRSSGYCYRCTRTVLFNDNNTAVCKKCNRTVTIDNISNVGWCVRCLKEEVHTNNKQQQKPSFFGGLVNKLTGLWDGSATTAPAAATTSTHNKQTAATSGPGSKHNSSNSATASSKSSNNNNNNNNNATTRTFDDDEEHIPLKMCMKCGKIGRRLVRLNGYCDDCNNSHAQSEAITQQVNNDKEMMKMVEDMGYSRPMVLAAVTKLRLDDDPVVNVKTIVHAITELTASDDEDFIDHDDHERVPIDYSTARPSAPSFSNNNTVSSKLGDDHFTTTTTTPSSKLSDYTTTATTTTTTTATTEPPSAPPLELSTDTSSERNTCKICFEYGIDTVLLPCAHRVVCLRCSNKIQQCPLCRQQITQVIRTFDS